MGVAVHVRRGDYLRWGPYGPAALPWDFYEEAMELVQKGLGAHQRCRFVFISDDLDYVRAQTRDRDDCVAIDCDELLGLAIMSECDHLVISASTFSWWGSELSRRRNACRTTIAPMFWAGWPGAKWYPSRFSNDSYVQWLEVPRRTSE